MDKMKVSIVVPIYKIEEALLRRCLDSLVQQTLSEVEILLVDDGCPLGGGTICDEYAQRYVQIQVIHQENQGVSAARNTGLSIARGEYYSFVDGDDYVSPDYCRIMYEAAQATGADIVVCGSQQENPDTGIASPLHTVTSAVYTTPAELENMRLNLLRTMALNRQDSSYPNNHFIWGHLYRRETMGDLRFHRDILGGEDKLFNFFALQRCKVYCSQDSCLYHYIVRDSSATHRFVADALERSLKTYAVYRDLPETKMKPIYRNTFYIRTCCMALAMSGSYFWHPDNPDKAVDKAIQRFCRHPIIAEAIQNADIRDMRLSKMKLAIYLLKMRRYKIAFAFARRCGL